MLTGSRGKSIRDNPDTTKGIYTMRIASMLTGLHPQTIRIYEKLGVVKPSRYKDQRLFSPEDIEWLNIAKALAQKGVNRAGIMEVMQICSAVSSVKSPRDVKSLLASIYKTTE